VSRRQPDHRRTLAKTARSNAGAFTTRINALAKLTSIGSAAADTAARGIAVVTTWEGDTPLGDRRGERPGWIVDTICGYYFD
jgi:hypothetical protein